jgi:hypothetical protein
MKLKNDHTSKNVILRMFFDYWDAFKTEYPTYDNQIYNSTLEAIFKCADASYGFKQFMCLKCGKESKIISFSCKSKFCLRCGRVSGEKFSHTIKDRLHPDVVYRHLILTIPEQLRKFFYNKRLDSDLFNRFVAAGWKCVQDFVCEALGRDVECGCLSVVHLVGRNCEYKPHIHVLMMAGGVDRKTGKWVKLEKFPYSILHQSWKKVLLEMFSDWDKEGHFQLLFQELESRYDKGFVATIQKGTVPKNSRNLVRYISKYLCRPHISLKRIIDYDPVKGEVEFEYSSHRTKKKEVEKVGVLTFLGRLLQQILPKGFQRIRYFGLQATKNQERLKFVVAKSVNSLYLPERNNEPEDRPKKSLYYRDLVAAWWRVDPFKCRNCGGTLELARIWKPVKGFVFSIFRDLFGKDIGPPGNLPDFCHQQG